MRRGRIITAVAALAGAAVVGVPGALAATPQQIYKDYQDNGRLDGNYSQKDLNRALKDAVLQGYSRPTSKGIVPAIKTQKNKGTGGVAGAKLPAAKKQGSLPFTGADLALMTVGGFSLLLLGGALRRFARNKA
jgi:opacity protein-like surface antigen